MYAIRSYYEHKRNSAELANLIDDIEAQAYLGKYYAVKIEAATELALLKASKDEQHREKAVLKLKKGIEFWTKYTEISEQNYKPQMLARTKDVITSYSIHYTKLYELRQW